MVRRFKAFICYSHADERRAAWLQRALEHYAVPRRLQQSHPDVPSRLYPVFRDREELGAAGDLSQSIRDALADSEALIVLCSPAARRSNWVDKEIVQYRLLHPQGRVLAVICDGSPEPSDPVPHFHGHCCRMQRGSSCPNPSRRTSGPKRTASGARCLKSPPDCWMSVSMSCDNGTTNGGCECSPP